MLRIEGLRKIHPPEKVAIENLDLEIGEGVFGLLGPNGAGKSSLMEILAANLDFEAGRIRLDDEIDLQQQPGEWRARHGYVPQSFDFPANITGRELMREAALMMGLQPSLLKGRMKALLERVNLEEAADREAARYSRGMKQRLGIVLALLHDPRLVLLDEPTAGLDPVERVLFRELLAEISRGRIVILSTHIVPDIDRCCNRVGVLDQGRLRYLGLTEDLVAMAQGKAWELPVPEEGLEAMAESRRLVSLVDKDGRPWARVVAAAQPAPEAIPRKGTLEDAYVYLLEG